MTDRADVDAWVQRILPIDGTGDQLARLLLTRLDAAPTRVEREREAAAFIDALWRLSYEGSWP